MASWRAAGKYGLIIVLAIWGGPARADLLPIRVSATAGWGLGSVSSATTVASRSVNDLGLSALAAYTLLGFYVGPQFEYRFIGQNTEPATVSNTNVRGNGYSLGAVLGYQLPMLPLYVSIGADFIGKYNLSNVNSGGQAIAYLKPFGLRAAVGYSFMARFSAELSLLTTSYGEVEAGGTASSLGTDKLKEFVVRLGGTIHIL